MGKDKLIIPKVSEKISEKEYRIFSIRVKEEIYDALEKIAGSTGHSRNRLIEMMLEFALERSEW